MSKHGVLGVAALLGLVACGSSSSTCTNSCGSAGAKQCSGTQLQTCTADSAGCLSWGSTVDCPSGETCSDGSCKASGCGPTNCASGCCSGGACQQGVMNNACGTGGAECSACSAGQTCINALCKGTSTCGPANCAGCCQGDICQGGTATSACGTGGVTCAACSGNQTCSGGSCQGGTCGPANCAGCCEGGICQGGGSTSACGTGGAACSTCSGGETCTGGSCQTAACGAASCPNGCCSGGTCVQGTINGACGAGGSVCAVCGATQNCTNHVCTGGAACGPANCNGCCLNGVCQAGSATNACGTGGGTCSTCTGTQTCSGGQCQAPACGPGNCNGCCQGGSCQGGNSTSACGSGGGGCSSCTGGETCNGGQCGTTCTNPCGGGCCAATDQCISNQCCPAAQTCGATCCSAGATCYKDQAGNQKCGVNCSVSSSCPAGTDCCVLLQNGSGVCAKQDGSFLCKCTMSSDCSRLAATPACVPDAANDAVRSNDYVCKPNDAAPYHGCNAGSGCCDSTHDCVADALGNQFCSRACTRDLQCGNAGIACCNTDATCHNCFASCAAGSCMTCTDGTCDPSILKPNASGGPDTCGYGQSCKGTGCENVAVGTCWGATNYPWTKSDKGPVIVSAFGSSATASDPVAECGDGGPKIEAAITFYAPNGISFNPSTSGYTSVVFLNPAGTHSFAAFLSGAPTGQVNSGSVTAGVCGATTFVGWSVYLFDSLIKSGNVECL